MRTCIYCGRELKDHEVCQCPQSVKMREERAKQQKKDEGGSNTYRTGYTKNESRFKYWTFRQRTKAKAKVNKTQYTARDIKDGVTGVVRNMIFDPISAVSTPGRMNVPTIIVMYALLGLALAGAYTRGLYAFLGNSVTLLLSAYHFPQGVWAIPALVLGMFIIFTLLAMGLAGILYILNRFIVHQSESYWVFSARIVTAYVPLIVATAIGLAVSFFAPYGMLMFIAAGLVMTFILLYEGMRTQWLTLPASMVFYMIGASVFIYAVLCYNIFRWIL